MRALLPGLLPSRHGAPVPEVLVGDARDGVVAFAAAVPVSRWVVVTDPGVRATGVPARIAAALSVRPGTAWVRLVDEVRPEPRWRDTDAVLEAVVGAEALVAIGGGSTLDTAKAALLRLHGDGPIEAFRGWHAHRPGLPWIAVPTTAGTGSEAQSFAVISDDDGGKVACGGPGGMPMGVVLDGALATSAPHRTTVLAAVDAAVHALETAVTRAGSPAVTDRAVEVFATLVAWTPRAAADPHDADVREALLVAACLAGNTIEASMLGAAHALANGLSQVHGWTHGYAVGWAAPRVIRHNASDAAVAATYARLARAVGWGDDPLALADGFAAWTAALGVEEAPPIRPDAVATVAARQWTGTFNPVPVADWTALLA
jgi:alcohol dehydrogenase